MKLLFIFSLVFSIVHGFRFRDVISNHLDISPQNECANQPNGVRLPHADCNRFILCDLGASLVLACRGTEPHFHRCEQRCVNDPPVCFITSCDGELPPTTPSTIAPPATTTTTVFIPPTVPAACPEPCETISNTCECDEQWRCMNGVCRCDSTITCPMTEAECMADPDCGGENGCPLRCECEGDVCFCNKEVECGFAIEQCAARCGCAGNCDCGTPEDLTNCVCRDVCSCIEPPQVCPFAPSLCVERCGCEERCLCNGNVCVCDTANRCPVRSFF